MGMLFHSVSVAASPALFLYTIDDHVLDVPPTLTAGVDGNPLARCC